MDSTELKWTVFAVVLVIALFLWVSSGSPVLNP